jgi:Fe-S cluster biogenesis protein NfuA
MKKGIKEKIVNYLNDKNILDIDIQFLTNVYDEVDLLFAERVRDYVNADGGQLSIAEIKENEGLVVVSLKGACSLCPHSMYTMSAGIESILKRFLPWVKDVKPLEKPVEPNFGFKLASKEEIRKKLMAKMKGSQV